MAERLLTLVSKRRSGTDSREILRLLGRLLGECIREQHGEAAFARVEGLRQHVVKEHRQGRSAVTLIRQLGHLPPRDLVLLIRAFAIFAELANIADDYVVRCQTEAEEQSPLERLKSHPEMTPERIYAYLAGALIAPVITAHPTEVRRKSIIDREAAIADLLPVYDHYASTEAKRAEIETQLKREIRILWQTRMLRPARIHVTDEIENLLGPSPTGSRLRRKHARGLDGADPHLGCAACQAAHRVARNYLAILSSSDRESEIGAEARRDLRFLCLPHLRLGLEIAPDRTGAANLFEIYARGAHEAIRDLAQYVRKQDYRHRDEPRGRETDSWIRAAYLMVGTPALRPSLRGSGGRPATRGGTA